MQCCVRSAFTEIYDMRIKPNEPLESAQSENIYDVRINAVQCKIRIHENLRHAHKRNKPSRPTESENIYDIREFLIPDRNRKK